MSLISLPTRQVVPPENPPRLSLKLRRPLENCDIHEQIDFNLSCFSVLGFLPFPYYVRLEAN